MPDKLDLSPLQRVFETQTAHAIGLDRTPSAGTYGDVNLPPHPAQFRGDKFINDPLAQQLFYRISRQIPKAMDTTGNIVVGPNSDVIDDLSESHIPAHRFEDTNLMGISNTHSGNIALSPRVIGPWKWHLLNTLSHELAHTTGQGETVARAVGDLMDQRNPQK